MRASLRRAAHQAVIGPLPARRAHRLRSLARWSRASMMVIPGRAKPRPRN